MAIINVRVPPDAEPGTGRLPLGPALMPDEVYVDDIIGGVPTVHLTPPDGPPIRFTLTADAARVLGIALLSSAEISKITGWGVPVPVSNERTAPTDRRLQVLSRLVDMASHASMTDAQTAEFLALTREEYPDVFADLADHLAQVAAVGENVAKLATVLGKVADRPPYAVSDGATQLHPGEPIVRPVSDPTPGE